MDVKPIAAVCGFLVLASAGCIMPDLPWDKKDAEPPPWRGVFVNEVRLRETGRPAAQALARLLEQGRLVPGVTQLAVTDVLPAEEESRRRYRFVIEGRASAPVEGLVQIVSPDYFAMMGTKRLVGRPFDGQDAEGTPPVAVINETMARQVWSEETPLGERLRSESSPRWLTIVGVFQDLPGAARVPEVYVLYDQVPGSITWFVLARAADPASVAPRLTEALRSTGQGLVHERGALEEILAPPVPK
jgi:hypothetical protein